jgi:uncharacterized protein (DUF983 family)
MDVESSYPMTDYTELPVRPAFQAFARGRRGRCPHCGEGSLFHAFLKVADRCGAYGEVLHHHHADDAALAARYFIITAPTMRRLTS